MSYQSTVNEIRSAATVVNPNGRFDHGRHVDLSQMFEGDHPIIYLYPFTVTPGIDPDFIDSSVLLLGFFKQDRPDTSNEEREKIIAEMDVLSTSFLDTLIDMKLVKVSSVTKEPQYQMYQGTISGYAVRLSYQNFSPC